MNIRILLTLGILALSLVGCSTVDSRIKEKSAAFNALDPQTQAKIRQGVIDVGFSTDLVYIALGKPDEVRDRVNTSTNESVWVYNTYYQQYEGTRTVGYRRHVYYDPVLKVYRVYYEPVRADFFSERTEERIRVSFVNGQVSSIEQVKDA